MDRTINDTSRRFLTSLNALADLIPIVCEYLLASWLWLDVLNNTQQKMAFVRSLRDRSVLAASVYGLALVILLACFHLYDPARPQKLPACVFRVAGANVLGTLGIGAVLYLFRLPEFSRGVLFVSLLFSVRFVTVKQQLFHMMVTHMFRKGYFHKNVLIIGSGALAKQYESDIHATGDMLVTLKGYVASNDNELMTPYLGGFDVLAQHMMTCGIDEAVIALVADEWERIRPIIALCDKCGTRASIIPFYNDAIPASPQMESVGQCNLINLRSNRIDDLGFVAFNRAFDVLFSLTLLILLARCCWSSGNW